MHAKDIFNIMIFSLEDTQKIEKMDEDEKKEYIKYLTKRGKIVKLNNELLYGEEAKNRKTEIKGFGKVTKTPINWQYASSKKILIKD